MAAPPITWEFDHQPNDPRLVANSVSPHFIGKYGWDSQTPGAECWGKSFSRYVMLHSRTDYLYSYVQRPEQ